MADVTARKRNGSSTWEYRIELAKVDGKRQQKSKGGFKTKAEALRAGRDALKEYESCGELIIPSEISVSDLFDKWMEEYGKTDLQQLTAEGYNKKIRLYIKPVIGMYKAKSITRNILQDLITNMADEGYSKNTVGSVRGIITNCFDWAELNHIINQNPAYRLKLPKNTKVKQRTDNHVYITKEQINKIFERFPEGTTTHIPMMIAYHCGLRLGEVYSLCWEDIDFENKTLSVNRQIQWHQDRTRSKSDKENTNGTNIKGGGYWYFISPKFNSYRTIEMDNEIISLLEREKKRQEKAEVYYEDRYIRYYSVEPITFKNFAKNDTTNNFINRIITDKNENEIHFVCRRESGEYTTPRTMQHASSVIHKQLDFPEFDFHSLRHTHATMLMENGAPMVYIQNRLGHAKVETTERIYTNHFTDTIESQGNNVLNNMF